jgi:hypothetical protein
MARIKGTNLSHLRDFVAKELGNEALARLTASLPSASRDAFASFAATGWYPAQVFVDVLCAIDRTLGKGDGALLRTSGAHAAEYDITRIHRLLFRFANPGFVLEKSTDIWGRFFDSGVWTIRRPTPTSADAVLVGWSIVDATVCEYLCAYLARMFEIVGARDPEVRHPECRARGAPHCRFAGSWR